MEEQNFVVKGSVILEWWNKKPHTKFFWSDIEENKFYIDQSEINPRRYYEFDLYNGEVELVLIEFADTLEELDDWL